MRILNKLIAQKYLYTNISMARHQHVDVYSIPQGGGPRSLSARPTPRDQNGE